MSNIEKMQTTKQVINLTNRQQLIDLNGTLTNFNLTFTITAKNKEPFDVIVVDQTTLDNNPNLDFKRANGSLSANIVSDKNVYQNFFLCVKTDKPCEAELTINKEEIPPRENIPEENIPGGNIHGGNIHGGNILNTQHDFMDSNSSNSNNNSNNIQKILCVLGLIGGLALLYYLYTKKSNSKVDSDNNSSTEIIKEKISPVLSNNLISPVLSNNTPVNSVKSVSNNNTPQPTTGVLPSFANSFAKPNQSLIDRLNDIPYN
jgi:hypothetical protein